MDQLPPEVDRYDIFISYCHEDNLVPPEGKQGWVTHFDQFLEYYIRTLRGAPAIWRDNKVGGSDVIADTILTPLPRAAILIAIVSPNYIRSEWCTLELEKFCDAATRSHPGIQVRNKSRIFKVLKVPLRKGGQLDPVFTHSMGFEFYQIKDKDSRPFLFEVESSPEAKQLFHDKVGDVAHEVIEVLELIEDLDPDPDDETKPPDTKPPEPAVMVYLAETTPDLNIQRDNVLRDLLQRGYKVLQLSDELKHADPMKLQEGIEQALKTSMFSIHLVGNEFGAIPSHGIASFVELQDSQAALWADQQPSFQRLIWIPANVKPQHHSQRRFITGLLDSNYNPNTELLRGSLEEFKTTIQDKIAILQGNTPRQPGVDSGAPTVGILCESLDKDLVQRLDDCIYAQHCDVVVATVEPGAPSLTYDQISSIRGCDGIIIYIDNAPLFWVQSRLQELIALEQQSGKTFKDVAVYVGGKRTDEKERFRTRNATVIKNFEDAPAALLGPIPTTLLRPFIDKLYGSEMKGGQAS